MMSSSLDALLITDSTWEVRSLGRMYPLLVTPYEVGSPRMVDDDKLDVDIPHVLLRPLTLDDLSAAGHLTLPSLSQQPPAPTILNRRLLSSSNRCPYYFRLQPSLTRFAAPHLSYHSGHVLCCCYLLLPYPYCQPALSNRSERRHPLLFCCFAYRPAACAVPVALIALLVNVYTSSSVGPPSSTPLAIEKRLPPLSITATHALCRSYILPCPLFPPSVARRSQLSPPPQQLLPATAISPFAATTTP
ncbi:hypothetical protein BHE74_00037092 [Ensete ventricosum]|nr:hypothetical protein BHE74_00037092 [Ensete ventricosum]